VRNSAAPNPETELILTEVPGRRGFLGSWAKELFR
jgi:hypothetical protein